ncbi:hypothetical protein HS088_TW15G00199 [Tripterygium wilfordii]|uniref:DUF4005 domain-containing protein n=1 Tax=Tripterygium wilfordii TaxID=458696 RepID=A0A7J7CKV8_TRIWF|nr:protein IQ-DOMAIN 31-like [Tripterygium wilfordii]XP_038725562.1 protein IQ-DOMAIN 31-like [Tripterygium wilfordii]XP_038725563.1 protein IQ-DOMAIN 31-like [Tripterygium wilfordii]XP_038725564.1 protein IQ-DOMAIN 31-like [Tripterygium wilfordii]XP_038725565.1 protein IQ-DOMAIN 31-like [Tripterygium wilfordii]XP_038725566.1 protein IQ-DOMAIN 31-like [Tripterygium wilfordii]KAF5734707.1 hypothetical protein HS088_TW15G00199 [Tripterygium wilfordii]
MGKSPAKWVKTVLFGKKSSKSSTSKGREKFVNEKEISVGSKALEANMPLIPSGASHFIPDTSDRDENMLEPESMNAANLSQNGRTALPANHVADLQGSITQHAASDPEQLRLEQAATVVQAAFRGYLARRAFWALNGIIRLQALIRGHLVRRQAVATFSSMLGLVKIQALIRGRKIRCSDIGSEVREKCSLPKPLGEEIRSSVGIYMPMLTGKLSTNVFIQKLLASSPTPMPLTLNYDSSEPNSVLNWLDRWSKSQFWKPVPQPKIYPNANLQVKQGEGHTVGAEIGRPKRSVRRIPAANNVYNSSLHATTEIEKPKRNLRKVSSHPAEPAQENPQIELEKVKRNLRKVHNPTAEDSVQAEFGTEKPKQMLEKESSKLGEYVLEPNGNASGEKKKETISATTKLLDDMNGETTSMSIRPDVRKKDIIGTSELPDVMKIETTFTASKRDDGETNQETLETNGALDLPHDDQVAVESNTYTIHNGQDESLSITNGESGRKDDSTNNGNQKSSRNSSTPAKQDRAENVLLNSPTLPSYMAATQSAKAKLRLQSSVEKNVVRRHSLPSTNSKINSQSPRTQRMVQASGKGGNRSDKSVLSSRDGNAKVTQAEWRR